MPEFTTVSVTEAQLWTIPGRQGSFMNEYVDYIQQVPQGQAGKLHPVENEKPATIRRRLMQASQALGTKLVIKRSGREVYFWSEGTEEEQPQAKRRYSRWGRRQAGTIAQDQPFNEPEEREQGEPEEESPELGQLASEAERRVAQS
jgi:hypothetical protein